MIQFKNLCKETPYLVFKEKYNKSLNAKQKNIEALCVSSYSPISDEVNARFVNLKLINNKEFIFFSNYNSPKSYEFLHHNQITCLIYWNTTNTQIRLKAHIKKTSREFNQDYFAHRDKKKNALAISSKQSNVISSYEAMQKNYNYSFRNDDLTICPDHWGGYSFIPFYFEFWEGHEARLNKRDLYELKNNEWIHSFLQP